MMDTDKPELPSEGLSLEGQYVLVRAYGAMTAERDRYKAALEKLRADADRAADMLTNGESAVRVFHVLDKALAALSPTPPKEP